MINQFHFSCARYNKFRWKVLFYVGHFVVDGESLSRSIGLKIESPIVNCKTDQHQQVISSKRTTLWMTYTDIHAQAPKIPISKKIIDAKSEKYVLQLRENLFLQFFLFFKGLGLEALLIVPTSL